MPDPLPKLQNTSQFNLKKPALLFICSWADDEPIEEVLGAANLLLSHGVELHLYITGKPKLEKYPSAVSFPDNVSLTGYLTHAAFGGYLYSCDIVLDLTTRDDCMVCGAYEGLAAEKSLVLSNNKATSDYFTQGVELTDNSAQNIFEKVSIILSELTLYQEEIKVLKKEILAREAIAINAFKEKLDLRRI